MFTHSGDHVSLVRLPAFRSPLGTQPQTHVRRLYRLPDHLYEIVGQGIEVRLARQLRGKGLQSLPRIVLPTVEAPIDETLDTGGAEG